MAEEFFKELIAAAELEFFGENAQRIFRRMKWILLTRLSESRMRRSSRPKSAPDAPVMRQ